MSQGPHLRRQGLAPPLNVVAKPFSAAKQAGLRTVDAISFAWAVRFVAHFWERAPGLLSDLKERVPPMHEVSERIREGASTTFLGAGGFLRGSFAADYCIKRTKLCGREVSYTCYGDRPQEGPFKDVLLLLPSARVNLKSWQRELATEASRRQQVVIVWDIPGRGWSEPFDWDVYQLADILERLVDEVVELDGRVSLVGHGPLCPLAHLVFLKRPRVQRRSPTLVLLAPPQPPLGDDRPSFFDGIFSMDAIDAVRQRLPRGVKKIAPCTLMQARFGIDPVEKVLEYCAARRTQFLQRWRGKAATQDADDFARLANMDWHSFKTAHQPDAPIAVLFTPRSSHEAYICTCIPASRRCVFKEMPLLDDDRFLYTALLGEHAAWVWSGLNNSDEPGPLRRNWTNASFASAQAEDPLEEGSPVPRPDVDIRPRAESAPV